MVLPLWHCAFQGCTVTSSSLHGNTNHEEGLWHHLWKSGTHKQALLKLINKYRLQDSFLDLEETAFTLFNQALAESQRQSCPLLGIATDRRSLLHLGEVFREDNVTTLMCFLCGCKHIRHQGFDKFGRPVRKGTIDYKSGKTVLHKMLTDSKYDNFWKYNLSYKYFNDRFGEAVFRPLLTGCLVESRSGKSHSQSRL